MDIPESPRILLIKLRHIGDVLLTAPVFAQLKRAFPKSRLTAVVPAGTEEMLTLNPDIDEVIPLVSGRGIMEEMRFIRGLRSRRFDVSINMTEGDRGAVMSLLSGARVRVGIDPKGGGFLGKRLLFTELVEYAHDGRHRVLMDLDVIRPLGIRPEDPVVRLYTSQEDDGYVEALLKDNGIYGDTRLVSVHPTSRWLFKCWRDEAVAAVVDRLEAKGIRVALTSGPDAREMEKARAIMSHMKSRPLDLRGRLTLKRLAALHKRSSLFFGVDSAPMHIAAAMGIPVVALFGPSDPAVWGPFTGRATVLTKRDEFPCIPCHRDGCGGSKKSRCLDAITEDEAVAAIEDAL